MEEILKKVSNPFDKENFTRLLSLYLESKDNSDFYNKVVTTNKETREWPELRYKKYAERSSDLITRRDNGHWEQYEYFAEYFPTEHRIYINSGREVTSTLVQKFMDYCIELNLPFQLKYAVEANDRADGIVIGSNTKSYKKHIDILRRILNESPELIEKCGQPHMLTANLDGWIGLADENVNYRYISYTQARLQRFEAAINRFLIYNRDIGKQFEEFELLDAIYNETKELYKETEDKFETELSTTLGETFIVLDREKLKNVFSGEMRDEYIDELYKIFQRECELQGIDKDRPTLYEGSAQELIENEAFTSKQHQIELEDKTWIQIINEYFSDLSMDYTMEEFVQLLSTIESSFNRNFKIRALMLEDVELLLGEEQLDLLIGNRKLKRTILNTERFQEINGKRYGTNELEKLRSKRINKTIREYGREISDEDAIQIIENRMEDISAYFESPMESVESKKQSVEILKRMMEKHETQNRESIMQISTTYQKMIDSLMFEINNGEALRDVYKKICHIFRGKKCGKDEARKLVDRICPAEEEWSYFYTSEEADETPIFILTAKDIGEASFDADTTICLKADEVCSNLLRESEEKDGHNQ